MDAPTKAPVRRGRPPVSSRREIEAVALDLFLERGFTETTLASITAAARVSKTSFFRYYPSKGDIIWSASTDLARDLAARLEAAADDEDRTMDLVRHCLTAALESRIDPEGRWLRRLEVIEGSAELRGGESRQGNEWTAAVGGFVARRHGLDPTGVVARSIGGAVHSAYLAALRAATAQTSSAHGSPVGEVDARLTPVTDALQRWLDSLDR